MATKNEEKGNGWLEFDLKEEFDKESFEKLFNFSEERKNELMHILLSGDEQEISHTLRQGTAVLNYFQHAIKQERKSLTAFQLGVLAGHLNCLNTIRYEEHQNDLAKLYFEDAKSSLPKYQNLFEKAILKLHTTTGITRAKELMRELSLESEEEVRSIMRALIAEEIVHHYSGTGYVLTDMGIRVAMQLTKLTSNS